MNSTTATAAATVQRTGEAGGGRMTIAIEAIGLTKEFAGRVAVDSLNLSVASGEFFSLLGLNGAGKTTTIRMLTCLLAPTSGDALLLNDSIVTNQNAVKQKINLSPQETAIAPNLTVRENLELIASIYGCDAAEARARAGVMIEDFGLVERAGDRTKHLSGGMQRRLSIAMALITRPEIVFLDEPTLGLDVRARRELWKALLALKGKTTIVLTTHYMEEAEALSDRIGVMHEGRLRALGTAAELMRTTGQGTLEAAFLTLTDEGAAA